ncbi:MAG: hypothetical protein EVA89_04945 [Sandaracinaceae bacterium]|nr:MAG: hypothetical protein EVA89_04945 [Sandaracinaceae bacterium]
MSKERSGGRWAWVAGMACGLTLALAAMPAPSARSQTASVERFEGAWRYVGGERDQRGLHAAIDRVVDELDLFTREIARVAIRRSLVPEPTLHVRVRDARHLSLQLGDWVSHEVELGRAATQMPGPDGNPTRFRADFDGGRIVTHEDSARGSRVNQLSLSPDGGHLFMHVRVRAPQLPADIRYALTYRRL